MNNNKFEALINKLFSYCSDLLSRKNREYTYEDDRLSNFKRQAQLLQTKPTQIVLNLVAKQIISLYDIIQNQEEEKYSLVLNEKIPDIINYMFLLYANIIEENPELEQ